MTDRTWRHKASKLIAKHCRQAYLDANLTPKGTMRARHVPYRVPAIAEALLAALDHDDEHEAKRLFLIEREG